MARLRCAFGSLWQRFSSWVEEEWFVFRLTLCSLCYNSLTSWTTVMDTALEPMFWFVEHFIRYLGPIFVTLVVVLTTSVVVIVYICLLPVKMSHSYFWGVYHLVFGHWLLVNIVFNYFKAAFTDPGRVPQQVPVVSGICKKCIAPKPPRAHHCSVCDRCILKMDHHCPWLNNCVGHGNHRYFFLFCAYMWIGCMYVSILAYPLFREHFLGYQDDGWTGLLYPVQLILNFFSFFSSSTVSGAKISRVGASAHSLTSQRAGKLVMHNLIAFEFLLCSAACIALGGLLLWHMRLIHRAETSIEIHTNRQEASRQQKLGLVYRNPYDFGAANNWRIFLGLSHGRTFWRHILLPSSHPPDSDGLTWRMAHEYKATLREIITL